MFSVTVFAGHQFVEGDLYTVQLMNLLGVPTIMVEGSLTDLSNVSPIAPTDKDYLVWVAGTGKWTPNSGFVFTGATATQAGTKGLVPAPPAGNPEDYLARDGNWKTVPTTAALDAANLYLASRFV
jgi:hypothetical protein